MAAAAAKIFGKLADKAGLENIMGDAVMDSVTDGDILQASGNFGNKVADGLKDLLGPIADGDGKPFQRNPNRDENMINNDSTILGGVADGDGNPIKKNTTTTGGTKPSASAKTPIKEGGCGCGCNKPVGCECEQKPTCPTLTCEEDAKLKSLCDNYKKVSKKKSYYKRGTRSTSKSAKCFKLTATQKKTLQALIDAAA